MASLYFHTLPGADATAVTRAAIGARWVKICDAGQIARVQALGCRCYYRPYLSGADNGDCGDGAAWAGDVWADLRNNGSPQPECIVMCNECNASVNTGAQYLRFRDVLRRSGYRGIVVLGSFAVGTPDWPEWAALKAGLGGYPPDAVDLHEYWDLSVSGSATYYALRHVEAIRRGLLPPEWPLFPGEIGSDAIWRALPGGGSVPVEDPQGRRGWQDRGKLTAEQQSANLAAYAAGCAPSVVAAFVFADGTADPNWQTFRTWDTPVEAAIRATWPGNAPQSPQDAPQGTGAAPTAPAPVVMPHAPVLKIGHAMPAPIFAYDQGWTKDCWLRCTEAFFLRYGYALSVDQIFQAAKGRPYPAGGEAATFAEVERGIRALAVQLGVKIQLAEFDDPPTVWNALHDADTANPWTIIIGVEESVLQGSSQQYGHFMVLDKDLGGGNVHVVDSYGNEDGDATGVYPWALIAQAMVASWEPAVDAIGVKIVGNAA